MKLLFIGGCADGRRIEVEDHHYMAVVSKHRPLGARCPGDFCEELVMDFDRYTRRRFASGNIMILESLEVKETLERLVECYRPGPVVELNGNDPSYMMHTAGIDLLAKGARPHLLIMKLPEE